jgi:hypothetical protein
MTDYTQNITFATKDALSTGDPAKVIKGSDIDGEFSEIETASATKLDKYAAVTELTALDDAADMLSVYDNNATAYKRITVANARVGLKFDNLVSAGLTANQTGVTDNTWVTVQFDDVTTNETLYDKGSDFDIGNYCFTAPADGIYLFIAFFGHGSVYVDGGSTVCGVRLEIDTGGGYGTLATLNYARNFGGSGTINSVPTVPFMADLDSGDKIRVVGINNYASNAAGEFSSASRFQIARLS